MGIDYCNKLRFKTADAIKLPLSLIRFTRLVLEKLRIAEIKFGSCKAQQGVIIGWYTVIRIRVKCFWNSAVNYSPIVQKIFTKKYLLHACMYVCKIYVISKTTGGLNLLLLSFATDVINTFGKVQK